MLVAGRRTLINKRFEHRHAQILSHLANLVLLIKFIERRSFLVHQMISRKMRHIERESRVQILLPFLKRLSRKSVNQVDADVCDS